MARDPFKDIPEKFRYHYLFYLVVEYDMPGWPIKQTAKIKTRDNRALVDFFRDNVPEDAWRISIPGTKLMHLWTVDDDWEVVVKLSEAFRDHMANIISRDVRT